MKLSMTFKPRLLAGILAATLVGAPALHLQAAEPVSQGEATQATVQLPDFRQLVKENAAAVVNIRTRYERDVAGAARRPQMPPFPEGSPFNDFFKRFFEDGGPQGAPRMPRQARGQGSGFIISGDGYILTNAHVVDKANEILVRLNDRRELTAELVGLDERTDVALLKIDADGLPTVTLGDSEALEVGEWVLAIGSPFGLEATATQGIVSALGRNLPGDGYVPFIQSDVAVNPGNSGGPLFDTRGQVVGINSMIFSGTGGYMGVSFAIPVETAMHVAEQLKTHGAVTRGYLGVVIQGLDRELAESFGMDQARGALVSRVMPGSPAAKAGIKVGDVIVGYDGQAVTESLELPRLVGRTPVDSDVPLTVLREGNTVKLTATIERLEDEPELAANPDDPSDQGARLNVAVADLDPAQRDELGLDDRGVLVRQVGQGPALEAGIQPGDVILSIDRRNVTSARQLRDLVGELPAGKRVPVLVQRGQGALFLAMKLPS